MALSALATGRRRFNGRARRVRAALIGLALLGPAGMPAGGRAGAAAAQSGAPAAPEPPPVAFTGGLDTRVREVSLHNLLDFDDGAGPETLGAPGAGLKTVSDAHFFRVRHRVWGQLKARGGARLYARAAAEWRKYLSPYLSPQKTEVVFDNLYLELPRPRGLPFTLRAGRQDIIRGDGFVLLEGGPGDGSRTIYHNALLLTLHGAGLGLKETQLDLLAIRNPAWDRMTIANGPSAEDRAAGRRRMVENDETAFGLYASHASVKPHVFDAYYFYKEEEADAAPDPHLRLHTLGGRAAGDLPWQLRYGIEGAYQFGTREPAGTEFCASAGASPGGAAGCSFDHRSHGGQARLSRSFLTFLHPMLETGAVYLSGDDPADPSHPLPDDRAWVPVFSRWPKWSELLIYTQIAEAGRVAHWTNLVSFYAALGVTLARDTRFTYAYHELRAEHPLLVETAGGDGAGGVDAGGSRPLLEGLFGTGTRRGVLHVWQVTTVFGRALSGHFLVERFAPGDFYAPDRRDDAYFVRWELMWKR